MSFAGDSSRIQALDVARGLAVFGILLMNMQFYSTPLDAIEWAFELWPAFWDRWTRVLLRIFAEGKFISLFSLLFGYSMVLFRDRAVERGLRFGRLWLRRMLTLLALGLCHGLFIWYGDILFHCGILGLFLFLFHKRSPKTLYIWATALLAVMPVLLLLMLAAPAKGPGDALDAVEEGTAAGGIVYRPDEASLEEAIASANQVYGGSDLRAIHRQRTADWTEHVLSHIGYYPTLLGLFLLGAGLAKQRFLHDAGVSQKELKRLAVASGTVGFGVTLLAYVLTLFPHAAARPEYNIVYEGMQIFLGAPATGLCYLTAVALAVHRHVWPKLLQALAGVGRLSLSNYIAQSLTCTWIFYGYGLGLFGKVGPFATSGLAVLIYAVQIAWSRWWVARFRLGPLEWLWRAATYWSLPSLRYPTQQISA